MKRCIILLVVLMTAIVGAIELSAQQLDTLWTRTYGGSDYDYGFSVKQTTDGGFIIAGETQSFGYSWRSVFLVKTNSDGNLIWYRTYCYSSESSGRCVQQTADGGYIITGYDNLHGFSYGIYLIKTDASGNIIWERIYRGHGKCVQQTADGGYIFAGFIRHYYQIYDVQLLKTNANGDSVWARTYDINDTDYGHSVQQTTDGGFIITGETASFQSIPNMFLIKTDPSGNTTWIKTYSGNRYAMGRSVKQTTDGGYIIVGSTSPDGAGSSDVYLVKTDANGDIQWAYTYGGNESDYGYSVQQTPDGGYILVGQSYTSEGNCAYIVRTNSVGETLWSHSYLAGGMPNFFNVDWDIQNISNNEFIVAGFLGSGVNDIDVWLLKLAPDSVTAVSFSDSISLSESFLSPAYPNPFNTSTTISYTLHQQSSVTLDIFNVLGRKVQSLHNGIDQPGEHSVIWNADGFSSGVYFYRLTAGEYSQTKKMVMFK